MGESSASSEDVTSAESSDAVSDVTSDDESEIPEVVVPQNVSYFKGEYSVVKEHLPISNGPGIQVWDSAMLENLRDAEDDLYFYVGLQASASEEELRALEDMGFIFDDKNTGILISNDVYPIEDGMTQDEIEAAKAKNVREMFSEDELAGCTDAELAMLYNTCKVYYAGYLNKACFEKAAKTDYYFYAEYLPAPDDYQRYLTLLDFLKENPDVINKK